MKGMNKMTKTISVKWDEFEKVVMGVIEDFDADAFAIFGGDILGGECEYNCIDNTYEFTPNEGYCDAFGPAEEE